MCDLFLNSEILQNLTVTVIANVIILTGCLQTYFHMAKYAMRYDRCTELHYKMSYNWGLWDNCLHCWPRVIETFPGNLFYFVTCFNDLTLSVLIS